MTKKANKDGVLHIAVIGAGASGMTAAIFAAEQAAACGKKISVKMYEGGTRAGKKILVTGNGRCNLTNKNMSPEYYRGSPELFAEVSLSFGMEDTLAFFEKEGLFTRVDNAGRVYPMSNQASSVLDTLRNACSERGIEEILSTKITRLERYGEGFMLNGGIYADRVILASGGMAAPVHGSDGSGYKLLEKFGVRVTPLFPALTALNIDGFTKSLKGIRADGEITLKAAGKTLASARGEIQYTEYGLSGIPVMQISRFAAEYLANGGRELFVVADSAPAFDSVELTEKLIVVKRAHPSLTAEGMLAGIMPKRLGTFLAASCSVSPAKPIGTLHDNAVVKLVSVIKKTKYKIASVRGFSDAQVTAGGVAAEEINGSTMELRKVRGLYVCGEITDVDGDCGGYNLQWAFSSGALAGKSVVGEIG